MARAMPRQRPGRSVQEVCTPSVFLRAVLARLGIEAFTVDLAASRTNTVARKFYSERTNALEQPWALGGWNWLNPPFSDLAPWVQKAYEESRMGARTAMLVPAGVGANWWRDWVHQKVLVLLLNGRIKFIGHRTPYPKDCALLLFDRSAPAGYETWSWTQPSAVPLVTASPVVHELAERNAEHTTEYSMLMTEAEVLDLAAGTVPHTVRANAQWLAEDLDAQLRRNADRPVRLPKERKTA